jgi:hypothetical protein
VRNISRWADPPNSGVRWPRWPAGESGVKHFAKDAEYALENWWGHSAEPAHEAFAIDRSDLIEHDEPGLVLKLAGKPKRIPTPRQGAADSPNSLSAREIWPNGASFDNG